MSAPESVSQFKLGAIPILTYLFSIIVFSKVFLTIMISKNPIRNSMYIIYHLLLVVIFSSRVYRELREIGTPQRQQTTDFQTGNLSSAEFRDRAGLSTGLSADRAEQSMQERVSRKTAEIEDDASSIGATTRTSFIGSNPTTYFSDDPRSDDFMHTLHSGDGERSKQSSFSLHDRSGTMNNV